MPTASVAMAPSRHLPPSQTRSEAPSAIPADGPPLVGYIAVATAVIVVLVIQIPTRSRAIHWIEDQLALLEHERQLGG